jgi:hypothetical protein
MTKQAFLDKPRKQWMSKYFNGLSLLSAAGIVSETFVKLGFIWRVGLIVVFFGSFALGLLFAKTNTIVRKEED